MTDRERLPLSFAELLLDESPDALLALSLDGKILWWNRGAEAIFGYSRDEAIGHHLNALIVPDRAYTEARQALDDAVNYKAVLTEALRRRKDGSQLYVDGLMRRVDAPGREPEAGSHE